MLDHDTHGLAFPCRELVTLSTAPTGFDRLDG